MSRRTPLQRRTGQRPPAIAPDTSSTRKTDKGERSNISPDVSTLFHHGPVQLIVGLSPRRATKGSKSRSL